MQKIYVISGQAKALSPLSVPNGITILDALRQNGYQIPASCNGNGTCGKCKVNIKSPSERTFTQVLSCHTKISDGMVIKLPEHISSSRDISQDPSKDSHQFSLSDQAEYGIAVDLGTTTVAASLIRLKDQERLALLQEWNTQISYGSDVISRTHYCMNTENGLAVLSQVIKRQLTSIISRLFQNAGIPEAPVKIMISGNTIMEHIFSGLSPEGMAQAPYTPVTLFHDSSEYMPCISSFVGGDITSGLYATDLAKMTGSWLFLDIGTNGEMAIGGKDGFLTCSVATGPAFEGAGITCGCINRPGAITHASWNPYTCTLNLQIEPDSDGTVPCANGICGSGLVDLIAILSGIGLIDSTGRIINEEELEDVMDEDMIGMLEESLGYDFLQTDADGNGIFYLTPAHNVSLCTNDVRNLQLAKASVRAGVELLLKEKNLTPETLDGVVIAGEFGKHLSLDSVAKFGMLPEALISKISFAGNSSLAGAEKTFYKTSSKKELFHIQSMCQNIDLADTKEFSELFLSYINL